MSAFRVELFLQCFNLANMDILSKSDPFVVVYHRYEDTDVPTPWVEAGRTETIWNEQNPRFQKRIEMAYMFNHSQGLKFEVYDRDSKREELSKHDFIGSAETTLSRVWHLQNKRHRNEKKRCEPCRGFAGGWFSPPLVSSANHLPVFSVQRWR